jgi:hypothetical protein
MKIYYDFSQFLNCSFEKIFEANLRLRKVCAISLKKSTFSFFLLGRKKKVNKLFCHHPKLTYKIIVQNRHEQVLRILSGSN